MNKITKNPELKIGINEYQIKKSYLTILNNMRKV